MVAIFCRSASLNPTCFLTDACRRGNPEHPGARRIGTTSRPKRSAQRGGHPLAPGPGLAAALLHNMLVSIGPGGFRLSGAVVGLLMWATAWLTFAGVEERRLPAMGWRPEVTSLAERALPWTTSGFDRILIPQVAPLGEPPRKHFPLRFRPSATLLQRMPPSSRRGT